MTNAPESPPRRCLTLALSPLHLPRVPGRGSAPAPGRLVGASLRDRRSTGSSPAPRGHHRLHAAPRARTTPSDSSARGWAWPASGALLSTPGDDLVHGAAHVRSDLGGLVTHRLDGCGKVLAHVGRGLGGKLGERGGKRRGRHGGLSFGGAFLAPDTTHTNRWAAQRNHYQQGLVSIVGRGRKSKGLAGAPPKRSTGT